MTMLGEVGLGNTTPKKKKKKKSALRPRNSIFVGGLIGAPSW